MFFVFGPMGQVYRGGPDNLARVESVNALRKLSALHPLDHARAQLEDDPHPSSVLPRSAGRIAANAYAHAVQQPPAKKPLTLVREVMTRNVVGLELETTAEAAWAFMARHGDEMAPVVDVRSHLVGLLLRSQIMKTALASASAENSPHLPALATRPVRALMQSPAPAVAVDTELRRVARVLLETGLPGLPVVEESGTLLGMITCTDILRAVAADPPLDLWT